jgi:antirestriction protein
MSKAETITPRIYVACLSSYNAGILHGRWIDATLGEEYVADQVNEMLADSPQPDAEEWAIHDMEALEGIGENETFERVCEIADAVVQSGCDSEAFLSWLAYEDREDLTEFQDTFVGEYEDAGEFAASHFEGCGGQLEAYVNWDLVGRDLLVNDYYGIRSQRGILIFWRR